MHAHLQFFFFNPQMEAQMHIRCQTGASHFLSLILFNVPVLGLWNRVDNWLMA